MTSRWLSLLIWAAVAASAVYWGLRLFVRPQPVPGQAVVAMAGSPAAGDLSRLMGAPPQQPMAEVAAVAAVAAESRFRLVGVVATRGGTASGLALISVDGKPARTVAVGRELEPGLRLLAVSQRQADLGAGGNAPKLSLSLPMLAEPNRGRPGEMPGAMPPGAMFGQGVNGQMPNSMMPNGQMPNGQMPNGQPGLPMLTMPRMAPGSQAGPAVRTMPAEVPVAELPADGVNPAMR